MARPPQYQHTNLLSARTALGLRLQDSGNSYWGVAELNSFLVAALRTWQALTASYREQAEFASTAGGVYYDLVTKLPVQYGYTVTDTQLVTAIQNHLLEPVGIPWTGSNQFTLDQVTQAVQKRRDQFLRDTGMVVGRILGSIAATPPGNRIQLPDTTIAVRRVVWRGADTIFVPLYRTDEFGATGFSALTTTPGDPYSYSVAVTPPVSLAIYPPPLDSGGVQILAVLAGVDLNPGVGVLLGVPDDYSQYVMFGALADLLGADGQCRDPQRAVYCDSRYQEGVSVGKLFPSGLQAYINGQPVNIDSTSAFDAFSPNWQNGTGTPEKLGFTGRNQVVLNPVADAIYAVSLDTVRNMPVPVVDIDFLQVGREYVTSILDYAQHLASFKMGGQEFQNTQAQYGRFIQAAGHVNLMLKAQSFYSTALTQASQLQTYRIPMETVS